MLVLENNFIKNYSVVADNRRRVEDVVGDIIRERKTTVAKKEYRTLDASELQRKLAVKGNTVFHGFSVVDKTERHQTIGTWTVTKTIYSAPVTLAFALKATPCDNLGDYLDKPLFKSLNFLEDEMLLSGLLSNAKSRETLYKLLDYFDRDTEMLEEFLKVYHPDLWHFRKLLKYISFMERSCTEISDVKRELDWALEFGQFTRAKIIEKNLNSAKENAEIVKRLKFEMRISDELPF